MLSAKRLLKMYGLLNDPRKRLKTHTKIDNWPSYTPALAHKCSYWCMEIGIKTLSGDLKWSLADGTFTEKEKFSNQMESNKTK